MGCDHPYDHEGRHSWELGGRSADKPGFYNHYCVGVDCNKRAGDYTYNYVPWATVSLGTHRVTVSLCERCQEVLRTDEYDVLLYIRRHKSEGFESRDWNNGNCRNFGPNVNCIPAYPRYSGPCDFPIAHNGPCSFEIAWSEEARTSEVVSRNNETERINNYWARERELRPPAGFKSHEDFNDACHASEMAFDAHETYKGKNNND